MVSKCLRADDEGPRSEVQGKNWIVLKVEVPSGNCVCCVKLSQQHNWAVFWDFHFLFLKGKKKKLLRYACSSANNSHQTCGVVKLAGRDTWLFYQQRKQA